MCQVSPSRKPDDRAPSADQPEILRSAVGKYDLAYGDTRTFIDDHEQVCQGIVSRSRPIQDCMGNHEDEGLLFEKYWPYPFVEDRYWSFNYGPVHVVVVLICAFQT
jgi:hypothetical protein